MFTHPRLVVFPAAEICARHFFVGRKRVTPRNLLLLGGMIHHRPFVFGTPEDVSFCVGRPWVTRRANKSLKPPYFKREGPSYCLTKENTVYLMYVTLSLVLRRCGTIYVHCGGGGGV